MILQNGNFVFRCNRKQPITLVTNTMPPISLATGNNYHLSNHTTPLMLQHSKLSKPHMFNIVSIAMQTLMQRMSSDPISAFVSPLKQQGGLATRNIDKKRECVCDVFLRSTSTRYVKLKITIREVQLHQNLLWKISRHTHHVKMLKSTYKPP